MKTHLATFFFFIWSFSLMAQVEIPIEQYGQNNNMYTISNSYFKDINGLLNKYIGTWEYNENGHYFKVQFIKQENYQEVPLNSPSKTKWTSDRIYARFQYKLNGVEIYNTLNLAIPSQSLIYSTAGSFSIQGFKLFYDEPSVSPCGRPLMGRVTLEHSVVNGVEKLTWSREDSYSGTFCQQGQVEDNTPFQIPANMILTKI